MDCPDIDQLIDYRAGAEPDPELETHLDICPDCRADLRVLQRIPDAYGQEIEVPERLIQRVLAELPEVGGTASGFRYLTTQTLITGLLGSVTAVAVVLGVQTAGDWTLSGLFVFALGIGTVSAVLQTAADSRRPRAAA